jgi:5'-3' exonuclease
VPPELRVQFDAAEDAVRALGVVVWSMREYEADDGLASGARRFRDEVDQVRILTPDKDLGQCLRGDRVIQVDRRQRKVTDEAAFRAARGFGPRSIPDFLALTGDSADGFPGLPGFGMKSASLLIGAYEHLERIPADAIKWKVKPRGAIQLAATLAERRDEAFFYRRLATLIDTVALNDSLDDLRFRGVPRQRFERWCDQIGALWVKAVPRRWE